MARKTDRVVMKSNGRESRIYANQDGSKWYKDANGHRRTVSSIAKHSVRVTPDMTKPHPGEYYQGCRGIVEFDDRSFSDSRPAYYEIGKGTGCMGRK